MRARVLMVGVAALLSCAACLLEPGPPPAPPMNIGSGDEALAAPAPPPPPTTQRYACGPLLANDAQRETWSAMPESQAIACFNAGIASAMSDVAACRRCSQ